MARRMSASTLLAVIGVLAAVVASGVAVLGYLAGQHRERRKSSEQVVSDMISAALAPLTAQAARIAEQATRIENTQRELVDRVDVMDREMAEMRVKVELFWSKIAVDMTRILHQPHPERQHIDALLEKLEAYLDHGGPALTRYEQVELTGHLNYIVHWNHTDPAPYPIYPGEQVAASFLLSAIGALDLMEE